MLKLPGILLLLLISVNGLSFQEITIGNKDIPVLTQEFFSKYKNLDKIRRVELISCGIEKIDENTFEEFTTLESLNLYNNTIRDVNFIIGSLKYLDLTKNHLKTPPKLDKFPKLKNLNLRSNFIKFVNFHYNKHQLDILDLSENPLHLVNITLGHLSDITIENTEYSQVNFIIKCPSLNMLDTTQVEITPENLDKICRYNDATVFMNFVSTFERYDCLRIENKENLPSEETFSSSFIEKPDDYNEPSLKEEKYNAKSSSDDKTNIILENSPQKFKNLQPEETFGRSTIKNPKEEKSNAITSRDDKTNGITEISVEEKLDGSSEDTMKELINTIREITGLPLIYLVLVLSTILIFMILALCFLFLKLKRIDTRRDISQTEHGYYQIPHLQQKQETSQYLTPGKICRDI